MTSTSGRDQPMSEAIEHERVELMQIRAMLKCLYGVLLYGDDEDSVMHADVANVCARLIRECVERLNALKIRSLETQVQAVASE